MAEKLGTGDAIRFGKSPSGSFFQSPRFSGTSTQQATRNASTAAPVTKSAFANFLR